MVEQIIESKPKFEINPDSGALVIALNRAVLAKQRGGEEHVNTMQALALIVANNSDTIEVLAATQES